MKIGIISDTHDHVVRVQKALAILAAEGVELLIHCGDTTKESTALLFRGIPTHAVIGNCDPDEFALSNAFLQSGGNFHGLSGQLMLNEVKIAWTHGHDHRLLHHLETSGKWDFVFHGHTHVQRIDKSGATTIINPGALHRVGVPTIGILDSITREYKSFEIE